MKQIPQQIGGPNDSLDARKDMKPVRSGGLGELLRPLSPSTFVLMVREWKRAGLLNELCDRVGARYGAGISSSRQLGNLCEAIYGKEKRDEYFAAFFASPNAAGEPLPPTASTDDKKNA